MAIHGCGWSSMKQTGAVLVHNIPWEAVQNAGHQLWLHVQGRVNTLENRLRFTDVFGHDFGMQTLCEEEHHDSNNNKKIMKTIIRVVIIIIMIMMCQNLCAVFTSNMYRAFFF